MKSKEQTAQRGPKRPRLSHACQALELIAPIHLAQSWDNVGLLAGDLRAEVERVLLCIDLTPPVVAEAIEFRAGLVVAYHPPIFKPIPRLTAQSRGPEAAVFRCISQGIAVYSMHTALDAADGGTNDVLAALCGITASEPLEYVDGHRDGECKFVVFVPPEQVDALAEAMFTAGAGRIGQYSKCSYRLEGYGTFLGSQDSNPTIGQAGRFERVSEVRLEMVCPSNAVPKVAAALVAAHPYEEPAYDIYPVRSHPVRGIGRHGALPRPIPLRSLAQKLKRKTGAKCVQFVGDPKREVTRAVIAVGAAGSLPLSVSLTPDDVIITGEMRHHDALTVLRTDSSAIVLNHWTSERPVLESVAERLTRMVPALKVHTSQADEEPFSPA